MAVEAFLWTLCVFKHYATCNNYALDFGFKLPTSEQLVHRVMDICKPVLRQPFDISLSMRDQPSNGRVFANNPYALYAADVKFQFALRLSRRFEEARRYISNKHKLYDYKTEASMNPHGGAIFVTVENQATCPNYMAGAVSDITFLSNRVAEKTSQ